MSFITEWIESMMHDQQQESANAASSMQFDDRVRKEYLALRASPNKPAGWWKAPIYSMAFESEHKESAGKYGPKYRATPLSRANCPQALLEIYGQMEQRKLDNEKTAE